MKTDLFFLFGVSGCWFSSCLLHFQVLAVRGRYEKELRGLHEDKNRSEEEIRQQLRDEKVKESNGRIQGVLPMPHLTNNLCVCRVTRLGRKNWKVCSKGWRNCRLSFSHWRGPEDGMRDG